MRLVAVLTALVARWRRRDLLLMAGAAGGGLLSVVWVMAADALGMAGYDARLFCRVARAAGGDRQQRAMR